MNTEESWASSGDATDIELARRDPNDFIEYVLRDEETGGRVVQTPMHREWQTLIEENKRVVLWSAFETGKSSNISVGRVIFEIGKNPNLRVVIVSNNTELPKKLTRLNGKYIRSAQYRRVFPNIVPTEPWNTTMLTVRREDAELRTAKDPTIQATSAHGNVAGSRIDLLVFDDVLDFDNCRTVDARKQLIDWAKATLLGRMSKNGRVWIIGNAWYPDDFMHVEAKKPRTVERRYPIVDDVTGKNLWPERWTPERLAQQLEDLGPFEFARKMKCVARDDVTARFKREWIDKCLERGKGKTMKFALQGVPAGYRTYTGVDLASSKKKKSDDVVLFTVAVHPNETRELLCIESGKWTGPEIVNKIVDTHTRFGSIVFVESNAAQVFIVDFAKELSAVPVKPFYTTGQNKPDPTFGVEALATEFFNGKWIIPSGPSGLPVDPEISKWIEEMLFYSPGSHTGDRLMAAWICREGMRNNKDPQRVQSRPLSLIDRR